MFSRKAEKDIREVFIVSLFLKAFSASVEILGGILVLFSQNAIAYIYRLLRIELTEDPTDFLANRIRDYLPYFSGHNHFYASFYFLSHGLIKFFLVMNLLRNRLWAYPATLAVLGLFVLYQTYRYIFVSHSVLLFWLNLFDLMVIILTYHEYKLVKKWKGRA